MAGSRTAVLIVALSLGSKSFGDAPTVALKPRRASKGSRAYGRTIPAMSVGGRCLRGPTGDLPPEKDNGSFGEPQKAFSGPSRPVEGTQKGPAEVKNNRAFVADPD